MFAWILGLSAAFAVALNGTMVTPMVVWAISRLPGYDEGSATMVAACEIGGIALYCFLLPHLAKRHGRIVVLAGFLMVIGGEALSAVLAAPLPLSLARFVTGLGEGAIFGLVASRLAARLNAERLWGLVNLVGGTTMGLLLLGLSLLPQDQADGKVFLLLSAFAVAMMPLALLVGHKASGPAPSMAPISLGRRRMSLTVVVVLLVYGVQAGQWAVAAFVGAQSQISSAEIGLYLAISSVLGFVGALAPALSGNGRARLPNIVVGFVLMGASLYAFFNIGGALVFVTSQIVLNIGFYMVTPYVTGLLTEGDNDGALMTRVLIVALVGASVGTAIAGPILDDFGPKVFTWSYLIPLVLAGVAAVMVFGRSAAGERAVIRA